MYDRRLAIESITRLGPGQFVLDFESPEISAGCSPGQFVMIAVADSVDPLLRRPMAIYRILRDAGGRRRGFSMIIEVVGRGTALLEKKRPGDVVQVLGPLGTSFEIPRDGGESSEQLLVMGGVGAAPFPYLAEEMLDAGCSVRAFVGARSADALLCVEDFRHLGVPAEVATDDGTAGHHGLVTAPLERHLSAMNGRDCELFACGPTPMMRAVHDIAVERRLRLQVSFEAPMACGIGVCLSCVLRLRPPDEGASSMAAGDESPDDGWYYGRCCREGPVFDSRRLVW